MNESRYDYFITIAQTKNITKAAELLFISQPALTKYLNNLEKELGTTLFERSRNGGSLTKAGEIYLKYAIKAQNDYNSMIAELEEHQKNNKKLIRFGLAANLSKGYFDTLLKIAADTDKDITFDVSEGTGLYIEKKIKNRTLDVAFIGEGVSEGEDFDYTVIKDDAIHIITRKSNPLLKGRKYIKGYGRKIYIFNKDEVSGLNFYLRSKNYNITSIVNSYLEDNNINLDNVTYLSDFNTMLSYIKLSDSFIFCPQFFFEGIENDDEYELCCIDGKVIKFYLALITLKNAEIPVYTRKWIENVYKYYSEK